MKSIDEAKARYAEACERVEAVKARTSDGELDSLRGKLAAVEAQLREAIGTGEGEMRLGAEAATLRAMCDARIRGLVDSRKEVEKAERAAGTARQVLAAEVKALFAPELAKLETGLGKVSDEAARLLQAAYDAEGELLKSYGITPPRGERLRDLRRSIDPLRQALGLKRWHTEAELAEADEIDKAVSAHTKREAELALRKERQRLDAMVKRGLLDKAEADAVLAGERERLGV